MNLAAQLSTLEASGLIVLARVQPELEYLFRHALVHEAAYSSLVPRPAQASSCRRRGPGEPCWRLAGLTRARPEPGPAL